VSVSIADIRKVHCIISAITNKSEMPAVTRWQHWHGTDELCEKDEFFQCLKEILPGYWWSQMTA